MKWTNADVAYLHENFHKIDLAVIAEKLNRSYLSCKNKAYRLSLNTTMTIDQRYFEPWTANSAYAVGVGAKSLRLRSDTKDEEILKLIFEDMKPYLVNPQESVLCVRVSLPPPEFHCHYVRGYMDAHACITFSKVNYKKYLRIKFIGNKEFLQELGNIICRALPVSKRPVYLDKGNHTLVWSKKEDLRLLWQWLYPPAQEYIFLSRKRRKLDSYFVQ